MMKQGAKAIDNAGFSPGEENIKDHNSASLTSCSAPPASTLLYQIIHILSIFSKYYNFIYTKEQKEKYETLFV